MNLWDRCIATRISSYNEFIIINCNNRAIPKIKTYKPTTNTDDNVHQGQNLLFLYL